MQTTNAITCRNHSSEIECAAICRRFVGEKVTYAGFPGTVTKIYSVGVDYGVVHGMVEVRLGSGDVCIDAMDAIPMAASTRYARKAVQS